MAIERPFPRRAAVAIRDMDQAGDPAHQGRLIIMQLAVRIGDLPQHFNQFDALVEIESLFYDAGESIQLVRIRHRLLAGGDQIFDIGGLNSEALNDQPGNDLAFIDIEFAVHDRGLDQQGDRRRFRVVAAAVRIFSPGSRATTQDHGFNAIDHRPCLAHRFGQRQGFAEPGFPLSGAGGLPTFNAMDENKTERLYSGASERNRDPILAVLQRALPDAGLMLEIGAGSGQHAAYFAPWFPGLDWQPTEPDPGGRASIDAWAAETAAPNLRAAMNLDVTQESWPVETAAAMFSANMIHISPWECCLGLMAGAGRTLSDKGVLCLYGPFKQGGQHTAPSNAQFDDSLKSRNPAWGIRDLEAIIDTAAANGLAHTETVAMPANNMIQIFHRRG